MHQTHRGKSFGDFDGKGIGIISVGKEVGLQGPCSPTVFTTESHLLVGDVDNREVAGLEVTVMILVGLLDGTAVDILI